MLNVRLAGYHPLWEIAVHKAVSGDVFDGVFLCSDFQNLGKYKSHNQISQMNM